MSGHSIGAALAGLALGFALMLPGHLFGATGAGDVKLFAAMGTLLGPGAIFNAFLYTAIAGGLLALVVAAGGGDSATRSTGSPRWSRTRGANADAIDGAGPQQPVRLCAGDRRRGAARRTGSVSHGPARLLDTDGTTERGSALLEMALTLPLLLLVSVAIFEFGRAYQTQQVLTNAAREGARMAVLPDASTDTSETRVRQYMAQGRLTNASTRDGRHQHDGHDSDGRGATSAPRWSP